MLAIPAAVVCLLAFSFIAGGLGFGNVVRPILNIIFLGLAGLGLVIVALGILYLTRKPGQKNNGLYAMSAEFEPICA